MSNGPPTSGGPPTVATEASTSASSSEPSEKKCDDEVCPNCGHKHPGFKFGDELPPKTPLRRGIRGDKLKDGQISKSAFQDGEMSCDMASQRSAAATMTNSASLVGTVEFTAEEATNAFPGNKVVFKCLKENPWHCQVEGRKTDGKAKAFAAVMSGRLSK